MYDDDDNEDAGISSGAGTNLKVGGMSGAMGRKFFRRAPPLFWLYKYNQSFW